MSIVKQNCFEKTNVRWAFFFLFPTRNYLWKRSDSHYAQRVEHLRCADIY